MSRSSGRRRRKPREITTPLTRLWKAVEQLARVRRVLTVKFRAWGASSHPQVGVGVSAVDDLGKVADRLGDVVQALEADDFVPPEIPQYKSPVEGGHVRIAPKWRDRYVEKCADRLRECPTLFDDLVVVKVYSTSRTVLVERSPYPSFEARRSHLSPVRKRPCR